MELKKTAFRIKSGNGTLSFIYLSRLSFKTLVLKLSVIAENNLTLTSGFIFAWVQKCDSDVSFLKDLCHRGGEQAQHQQRFIASHRGSVRYHAMQLNTRIVLKHEDRNILFKHMRIHTNFSKLLFLYFT